MECPATPNTLIAQLLKQNTGALWEKSWNTFFDVYYVVMHAMTINSFKKFSDCEPNENDVEDVITQSFVSIMDSFKNGNYQPCKYRFRGFLKRIINCRVVDHIRKQTKKRTINVESIEIIEAINQKQSASGENYFDKLEDNEATTYRLTIIMDVWENIRPCFSPETCIAFEMRMLEGKSVQEVCDVLQVDRTKVDKSVFRITKRIKEEISKEIYQKELSK